MNWNLLCTTAVAATLLIAPAAEAQTPLGTSFSYQAQLRENGQPFSGSASLVVALYDADTGGNLLGVQALPGVAVVDGLFSVVLNGAGEFGPAAFNGERRWIDITVNGVSLAPRHELTTTPYASFAAAPWVTAGPNISYTAGNVGVGTSTPATSLHVVRSLAFAGQNDPPAILEMHSCGDVCGQEGYSEAARLLNSNINGRVGLGFLSDGSSTNQTVPQLWIGTGYAGWGQGSDFHIAARADETTLVDRFTVNGVTGNVGIGTSNPGVKLHVVADGYGIQHFSSDGLSDVSTYADGSGGWIGTANNKPLLFFTANGGAQMILQPDGQVGVGPLSASQLSVAGNADVSGILSAGGDPGNPWLYSNYLGISGRQDGGPYPGSAGIVIRDPVASRSWAFGINTNGAFSFQKFGGGVSEVAVPVLRITGGSDVAEPFNVHAACDKSNTAIQPGMVVAIDSKRIGELRLADKAYDKAVAGIISGANGVNPGMVLAQEGSVADGKHPVALTGRVWCWCDADAAGPIVAGDLLTTSDVPGHAMRVADHDQAAGAIIGKAMSPLTSGRGLVLVLVSLQ